ncbi:MAG: RluA family pseudouridine synthase [Thermotogota bacterium]|nr:RluA family pseudouridine synthase [Thermotogota bacterium]
MSIRRKYTVSENNYYERLDRFLRNVLKDLKLGSIYKLIRTGNITINGKEARKPFLKLSVGDSVEINYSGNEEPLKRLEEKREPQPLNLPLKFIYEDDYLIAVDKPPGISMHPGKGIQIVTIIEGLLAYGENKGFKPRLVHRLDKHTSGVLVVAKTPEAARRITEMFKNRDIDKYYVTLIKGNLERNTDKLIDFEGNEKMELTSSVKNVYNVCSLVDVKLLTGKKHQIRIQFSKRDHPVLGDEVYGDKELNAHFRKAHNLKRYFLHCSRIEFEHPFSGHQVKFSSKLPDDLTKVKKSLEQ